MVATWPIFATRHRAAWAAKQIAALMPQLRPGEKVTVAVDDDAETERQLLASQNGKVEVVALPRHVGPYLARDAAIRRVPDGAIVVELDDHDIAEPGLLAAVRAAFEDSEIVLAYCDIIHSDPQRKVRTVERKKTGLMRDSGMLARGMRAYRKEAYVAVGGYTDEWYPAGDFALACKMEAWGGGRSVQHIREPLVTVTSDCRGISGQHRQAQQDNVYRIAGLALRGELYQGLRRDESPMQQTVRAQRRPSDMLRELPGNERLFRRAKSWGDKPHAADDDGPAGAPQPGQETDAVPASRKPRVLISVESWGGPGGGGELTLQTLAEGLAREGWQVCVMAQRLHGEPQRAGSLVTMRKPPDWATVAEDWLKAVNPDVVIANDGTLRSIQDGAQAAGIPLVCYVQFWRNLLNFRHPRCFDALTADEPEQDAVDNEGIGRLRACAAVVANSEFTRDALKRVADISVTAVVEPPLQAERCRVAPEDRDPGFVVCVGAERGKGVERFLDMAERFRATDRRFCLVEGDARRADPRLVARAEGLDNVEVLRGWQADMRPIYARAQAVYVGTQTAESYCRVAAEARLNGIPLLVSDAGNLPNMAADEHGKVVPKGASLSAWCEGLGEALQMTTKPDLDIPVAGGHQDALSAALHKVRRLGDVCMLVPTVAPGVRRAVEQWAKVLGITPLPWAATREDIGRYSAAILPGLTPPEPEGDTVIARLWCSHAAQMDTSRHEMIALSSVVDRMRKSTRRWLLMTSKADAEALAPMLEDRVRWLPNVLAWEPQKPREKLAGRNVWVVGPYCVRKNPLVAILAAHRAGARVHASAWLKRQARELVGLCRRLGAPIEYHDCRTSRDVMAAAGTCTAAVCLSTAETYCYAVAECVMAGVPVVAWRGMPALGGATRGLVNDPTNLAEVRLELERTLSDPEGVLADQIEAVQRVAEAHAVAARKTLLEVLGA